MRLPDGSRLFAIMDVTQPPSVTIRRHRHIDGRKTEPKFDMRFE